MLCNFHHLNGGIVTSLDTRVDGQRHLGQTDSARVRVCAGADDLEGRDHWVAHVLGPPVGPVGAVAEVDVDKGGLVALEPTRLDGDGAAGGGPEGAVA